MQGKILIVDSVAINRIMLKVKLASAYYDVVMAASAAETLAQAQATKPDLILLSMDLSQNQAVALCRSLKSDASLKSTPVIIITAQDDQTKRIAGLAAGADDVLSKPLDDLLLLARIRSLLRASSTADELRLREGTTRALGFAEETASFDHAGQIALLSRDETGAARMAAKLKPHFPHTISHHTINDAMGTLKAADVPDVFVIALDEANPDQGLRLLADIRARAATRHAGILVVSPKSCPRAAADSLDLGANDLMPDGADPTELALRLSAQMKRKRIADRLRDTVHDGLQAAVTDPLTGLYNRRYAIPHLTRVAEQARKTNKPFAVMVADLDHFKNTNDIHGHSTGDAVLIEVAKRLRQNLRAVDLVARIGGEEFLIVMPSTDLAAAQSAADRLCREVEGAAAEVSKNTARVSSTLPLSTTISIGVSVGADAAGNTAPEVPPAQSVLHLLDLADQALYRAKNKGRNCVRISRPAA